MLNFCKNLDFQILQRSNVDMADEQFAKYFSFRHKSKTYILSIPFAKHL